MQEQWSKLLMAEYLGADLDAVRGERLVAGQQLVQDDAERVDVAADVQRQRVGQDLLRDSCTRASRSAVPYRFEA